MRNYKWMLKTWAGSKRLKGMRDLKEDMYNSDIWLGCLGWEIKKNMKTKKKQRTKTQLYKIVTTAQIPI